MLVGWESRSVIQLLIIQKFPLHKKESHGNLLDGLIALFCFPQRICSAFWVKAVKPDFSTGWTTAAPGELRWFWGSQLKGDHISHPSACTAVCCLQLHCPEGRGTGRVPLCISVTLTGCTSISATPEPLGPALPLLEGLHSLISAASVLPSLPPLYSVLRIYRAAGLLSSTAPCSESLAMKVRHAVGQRGQSWGWQKMVSAGVVPLHNTLALLSLQSPLQQQAHGHPLWCGERCYWFVHLGELLVNQPCQPTFMGMSITTSIPQAHARWWSEALMQGYDVCKQVYVKIPAVCEVGVGK